MELPDLNKHFPYDKPREQQTHAITIGELALLNSDKRFFILEAGTGVGKSAIGLSYNNSTLMTLETLLI